MIFKKVFALLALIAIVQSISLKVGSMRERCMILSTFNQEHLLKIDLKFQKFQGQKPQQGYRIVLHNTETHEEQAYQVISGVFRREFQLTQNVIYRLCFKIVLSHQRDVSTIMEYFATTETYQTIDSTIKVPQKLLKVNDLQNTYTQLARILRTLKSASDSAQHIKTQQQTFYDEQISTMNNLQWVSIFEIVVICFFGCYQFWKLRNIIQQKTRNE